MASISVLGGVVLVAGPASLPAGLKLLHGRGEGRDSGGRKVESGPAFKRTPPVAPALLEGAALEVWNRIVPELTRLEVLKDGDAEVLATYCVTYAAWEDATRRLAEDGRVLEDRNGMKRHPSAIDQIALAKELRAIAGHFGLTPSTEQALAKAAAVDEDDNPFD